jgi:hypothetical protein
LPHLPYWTTGRGVEAMDNSYDLLDMTVKRRTMSLDGTKRTNRTGAMLIPSRGTFDCSQDTSPLKRRHEHICTDDECDERNHGQ